MWLSVDQGIALDSKLPTALRRANTSTRCNALIEDVLPQILSVDRSVYAALASCLCTLCAVHVARAWGPTAQVSTHADNFETARSVPGVQPGSSAPRQRLLLPESLKRGDRDDSAALALSEAVDWANPTETDMWRAAESGVLNTTPPSTPQQVEANQSNPTKSRCALIASFPFLV